MKELIEQEFQKLKNPSKSIVLQKFFKTNKGEYAEGDLFLGIMVPQVRILVKKYPHLSIKLLSQIIQSPYHEIRLFSLLSLVQQFKNISKDKNLSLEEKKEKHLKIVNLYTKNIAFINNWDLVDLSARDIIGEYLYLYKTSKEQIEFLSSLASEKKVFVRKDRDKLWEKRIAVLSTFQFLYYQIPKPTLIICELLLHDTHDLIHKATGWMLREMGKKCGLDYLRNFLTRFSKTMPRTMLRYAIEKLNPEERKKWMAKV